MCRGRQWGIADVNCTLERLKIQALPSGTQPRQQDKRKRDKRPHLAPAQQQLA